MKKNRLSLYLLLSFVFSIFLDVPKIQAQTVTNITSSDGSFPSDLAMSITQT